MNAALAVVALAGERPHLLSLQHGHRRPAANQDAMGADGSAPSGIYELGGPRQVTLRQVVQQVLEVTGRRRWVLNLPFWLGGVPAALLDAGQWASGGLVTNRVVTRDQLRSLRVPNRVAEGARGFADLGITPTAAEAVIPEYLWRFRPRGQYEAMKASAKNLRMR